MVNDIGKGKTLVVILNWEFHDEFPNRMFYLSTSTKVEISTVFQVYTTFYKKT